MASAEVWIGITILVVILVMVMMASCVRIIQAYECGILIVLGRPTRILYPGYNLVPPMISQVKKIRMDSPTWEQEFKKYLTPEFSKEFEKFKMDAMKYYTLIAEPRPGGQASISCPNCHKIITIDIDDYIKH